jgi:hypothetical protein
VSTSRDGSELCLSCGMCCDGSLFSDGRLLDDEVDRARSLDMAIVAPIVADGLSRFRQPCACFRDGSCAVYDTWKPDVCTTYRCELLDGFTAGTIDLASCRDVVGSVQSVQHELEAAMGLESGAFTYARLLTYALTVRPHEEPERHVRFMAACNRYLELGKRHFRFPTVELAAIVAEADHGRVER